MRRQLLWVLAGLLCLPLLLVLTAPELLQARPTAALGLLALVIAAGVPGLVALVVVAVRKRGDRESRVPEGGAHPPGEGSDIDASAGSQTTD